MPLYEYLCEKCGESFEVIEKFSDEPLKTHSKCGGPVHRLISAPALQFKGSGWYVTDYAKSSSSGNGSSKSGESSESKSSKSSGESKSSGSDTSSTITTSGSSEKKSSSSDTK